MKLLDVDELEAIDLVVMRKCMVKPCPNSPSKKPFIDSEKFVRLSNQARLKATGKKILIELQAIYKDGGMFHKKMGEFIKELKGEVK